ncbi:aquaporin [Ophiobolus disseminans]|uniref:Aquaporin n=1 Tax=Ophiobolus disseminans TaxID=1469910 RepID=A0A6A6ZQ26_9PLEO|nr:aquaporin [Ophiobolus disseminans]
MVLPGMKPRYTEDPNHPGERRLPGFGWLPNRARHLLISCLGEFVGTFLFLFFAFAATQVANNLLGKNPMNIGALLYISLAFGFSLAVNVWIFFRISGGQFNPAVTIALAFVGAVNWLKAGLLIFSQIIAGIAAAAVVAAVFPGPLAVRTSLGAGTSVLRGLFIELFLTFELVLCILMLAAEKHKATFLAPIGIGLALFIAELAGVLYTGGSLNPARSFGPDVVLRTFDHYHWIYWIGPLLGALSAVVFYRLIKALGYESANPGADSDGLEPKGQHGDTIASNDFEDSRAATRRTTDGTDESDYAPRRQTTKRYPVNPTRATMSSHVNTMSLDSTAYDKPNQPAPAFIHGGDGHRSESSLDHPNNRPRAHHSRSSRRSSHSHFEMMPSDDSYRSGPDVESGRSSS